MQLITLITYEILVRKRVVGFTKRLKISKNSIINCIDNSWKIKFDIWNPWIKLLYIIFFLHIQCSTLYNLYLPHTYHHCI